MKLEKMNVDERRSCGLSSDSQEKKGNVGATEPNDTWLSFSRIGLLIALLLALYWTSRNNYLLFHTISELASIAVAWALAILVWNTRKFSSDDSLSFLGVAYLFVGFVDLLHTLAYKGMGVFPDAGANLPTQLWIVGRYIESISLLIFAVGVGRFLRLKAILAAYTVVTTVVLMSIFSYGLFPDCFIEGSGLTPFKKNSEYLICLILMASAGLLWQNRQKFDQAVLWLLVSSIGLTVLGELAFTFYISVFGISNLVGHYFKILSFFLVYLALIHSGLRQPYSILFRNLALSEQKFRFSYESSPLLMGIMSMENGTWTDVNKSFMEVTGYGWHELIGVRVENSQPFVGERFLTLQSRGVGYHDDSRLEVELLTKNGSQRTALLKGEIIEIGTAPHLLVMMQDITEEKKIATERRITLDLMKIINEQSDMHVLIRDVCRRLAEWSDMEAVGVRLKDGDDFPYFEWCGFPPEFIEAESSLCARDCKGAIIRDDVGRVVLECMCGNVLSGRYNLEQPFFSDYGSFYTNSTSALLASTGEDDRLARTRNRCNEAGYESVALIPLRFGQEIIGLLQLNDKRKDRFTNDSIIFFEQLAGNLAVALKERNDVQTIKDERSLMRSILSATPDIYLLKDTSGTYQMVNQAFCKHIGKPEHAIIGKKDDDLYPLELASKYCSEDRDVLLSGQVKICDREHEGDWFHVIKTPISNDEEELTGILVSMKNISSRKRTEQLLKARLLLSEYASSHSLEELLIQTLDEAERLTGSNIGFFHYILEGETEISLQQWSSRTKTGICSVALANGNYPLEQAGIWADSVRLRKPLIWNDYESMPNKRGLPKGHVPVTRMLTVPVFSGDTIVAMLGIGNKPSEYDDHDVQQVSTLATMAWDIVTRKRAEDSLQQWSGQVERMMDNLPGMVYRCANDEEWTMEFVSNGAFILTGYKPEALIRSSELAFADVIEPQHRQRVWRTVQDGVAAGAHFEMEYPLRHKDGTVRWVWERGRLVTDDLLQFSYLEGFITDITEHKRAREHVAMQARVLNQISDRVTTTDLNGNITYVNLAQAAAMKVPQEWFAGKNIEVFDQLPKTTPPQEEILRNTLKDGRWHGEVTNIAFDGSILQLDLRTDVIHDDAGKAIALCGVATDLTETRKRESELRRLVMAIEQAAEIIMITDEKGRIEYVNPSFSVASGYSRDDVMGKNPRMLKSGQHNDQFYDGLWNDLNAGHIWQGRVTNRKKDGSLYTQEGTISPVKDEKGRAVNFVAVMHDITDMLGLEERLMQAQRLEAIGTLAGGIAHDFNNILFPILGIAEILQEDIPGDSPLQDQVSGIIDSAMRAADLVKQILAFSRQGEMQLKPVKVQFIVKEVVKLTRATLPSTIKIVQTADQNCPLIMADATQIHQVVMNLVTNAFHAMEGKGGTITILLKSLTVDDKQAHMLKVQAGRYVCLTVRDTGEGIASEVIPKIFDPYFTTKAEGKGTGLGLSMSHGIVKKYGGAIDVESRKNEGSTFRVYLPSIEHNESVLQRISGENLQGGSERILLVDDEVEVVKLVDLMLTRLGYRVTSRTSSLEALQLFLADPQKFDLVLTDLTMPNMTGDRLAIEIKRLRSDLPVVVFTGFSEKMDEEKSRLMGIDGYLLKPVLKKDLAVILRNVLDRHAD